MNACNTLYVYTVYERPRDYPEEYVCRRFEVGSAKPKPEPDLFLRGRTLSYIRLQLRQRGLVCVPRNPLDDPCIVEVWV